MDSKMIKKKEKKKKGYHPNLTIHPERELAPSWAKEFVTDLDKLHQHL